MNSSDDRYRPSAEFEARLFEAADELLRVRRDRVSMQEARSRKISDVRSRTLSAISPIQVFARATRLWVLNPAVQVAAIAIITSVVILLRSQPTGIAGGFTDLPEFSKVNDSSARYESQVLLERQAYEREVEDAHARTSGGI